MVLECDVGVGNTWCWSRAHLVCLVVLEWGTRGVGVGHTWCWSGAHVVLECDVGVGHTWCWSVVHVVLECDLGSPLQLGVETRDQDRGCHCKVLCYSEQWFTSSQYSEVLWKWTFIILRYSRLSPLIAYMFPSDPLI